MVKEMLDKDLRRARYCPSPVSEHRWGQTGKINLWLIFEMEDGGMKKKQQGGEVQIIGCQRQVMIVV